MNNKILIVILILNKIINIGNHKIIKKLKNIKIHI